jgi:1,4-dihydroxy-2-naphthoyl-CoA hydrolase
MSASQAEPAPSPFPADPTDAARAANSMVAEGGAGTMIPAIGLEYLEIGPDRIVARIPVERNTQPYGLLHGGATAALCETVASFGTAFLVGLDKVVTGVELNVNHIRAVRSGHVTATGVPLHVGRTTAVWDMRVVDDEGRLVAVSRLTLVIREPSPAP